MEKLGVSVIIIHYKCWPYLEKNLISLRNQTKTVHQIVIVNNGSLVDLEQELSVFIDLPIELINNLKNVGFGAACNQAADLVPENSLILFCNPDVEIPSNGIELLTESYEHAEVDILGCQQANSKGKPMKHHGIFPSIRSLTPFLGYFYKTSKKQNINTSNGVSKVDWITGSVILISKKSFDKLTGFDEDFFMFMEDIDLCKRAKELDLIVGTTDQTEWLHYHGKSSTSDVTDRIKSKTEAIKSKHTYLNKHFKNMKILGHLFVVLKYSPELLLALILGVFVPAREVKVKQAVAISLIKNIFHPGTQTLQRKNNG